MNTPLRRSGALVLASALTFAVTACGSEQATATKPSAVSTTSITTRPSATPTTPLSSATSATVSAPASGDAPSGRAFAVRVRAAVDAEKSVHVFMSSPGEKDTVTVDMTNLGEDEGDAEIHMGATQMRSVGDTVYLKDPELAGRTWLRVDDDSESMAGLMLVPMAIITMMADVDTQIDLWERGTATTRGTETVNGARTTHYTVRVPGAAVVEVADETGDLSPNDRAEMRKAMRGKTVAYEVWLDPSDRPARVRSDLSVMAAMMGDPPGESDGGTVAVIDYSRWGETVRITAPPAGQVKDADEALGEDPTS
ncbi:LolA-like protein [Luteipulveratus flavus]|uniref:LppX_LprAFG lipoprotein n=1 Tax=Luteipulveratus flavus TaxID=3031728 RepID=A0ABT6C6K0_9MICO|nr:hypothetical protein [Luteipulveratus sp. YIM 133296]MDF8264465.1 hypothetical protein [Luteipulveratus sp. YIM 133296]